jgi:hypothetical protein
MAYGELITLINRAPISLIVLWDGREWELKPGENPNLPKNLIYYAKNQHPIMGSENPHTMRCGYLVAVAGTKDEAAPLTKEQWKLHCTAQERWDRSEGSPIFGENVKPTYVSLKRPLVTQSDIAPAPSASRDMAFGKD